MLRFDRRHGRPRLGLVAASGTVLTILFLASPYAAGVPLAAVTLVAPYKGTTNTFDSTRATQCGNSRIVTAGFFSHFSGRGGFGVSAASRSCGGSTNGSTGALAEFDANSSLPFLSGATKLSINLTYSLNGSLAFKSGSCTRVGTPASAYCYQFLSVNSYVIGYWVDKSSGASTYIASAQLASNFTVTYTSCGRSGCSTSSNGTVGPTSNRGSASWVFTLASPMLKSHKYSLELKAYVELRIAFYVHRAKDTGGYGSGSINCSRLGHGILLTSLVLS